MQTDSLRNDSPLQENTIRRTATQISKHRGLVGANEMDHDRQARSLRSIVGIVTVCTENRERDRY